MKAEPTTMLEAQTLSKRLYAGAYARARHAKVAAPEQAEQLAAVLQATREAADELIAARLAHVGSHKRPRL
jgi:hypothetical protein